MIRRTLGNLCLVSSRMYKRKTELEERRRVGSVENER